MQNKKRNLTQSRKDEELTERIEHLLNLNEEQAEIIRSDASRIAVCAGAGSGKTRLIVARCLSELESGKAGMDSIAAITFTENAATEIRERIAKSIGDYIKKFGERGNLTQKTIGEVSTAQVSTIHGLAARIIRENLFDTGFPAGFEIAGAGEADEYLNTAILETVLKLRAGKGPESEALNGLLENELFNLDAVMKNIALIVRGSMEKHLPRPLALSGFVRPAREPAAPESVKKMLGENDAVFRSNSARKRFEKAKKMQTGGSAALVCRELKNTIGEITKIWEMKTASPEEKEAARAIAAHAERAVDLLNSRLTELYLPVAEEVMKCYEEIKARNSAVEYGDLLTNALQILRKNHPALSNYRKRFGLIMVDEFQDTDSTQNKIISLLSGEKTKIMVVGDTMQSIYSFRGAEPKIFRKILESRDFEKFRLRKNYRTSSGLTDFINNVFKNVFDDYTRMEAVRESGGTFQAFAAEGKNSEETRLSEAVFIAEKISELTEKTGYSYSDIALIFRRSKNIQIYERALRRAKLPFKRTGETEFSGLAEIRDMVSMMRFIANPLDETAVAAVLRSPFFGISDTGLARYFSEKRKTKASSFGGFLKLLSKDKGEHCAAARYLLSIVESGERVNFSSPLETARFAAFNLGYAAAALALPNGKQIRGNIIKFTEMSAALAEKGAGLHDAVKFFNREPLPFEDSGTDGDKDSVTLITSHGAKGLEFPVVFIADTNYSEARERGKITVSPEHGVMACHDRCGIGKWKQIEESGRSEEEKRILYVTMTRAADAVFTQRHEKPRRSSLAGIIESALVKLPDFKDAAGGHPGPALKKKRESGTGGGCGPAVPTLKSLSPLYTMDENPEDDAMADGFRTITKTEEGEIMHRFFEMWDFSPESVEELADFVAAERFIREKRIRGKIIRSAENALGSPLAEMARNASRLRREYDFTIEKTSENTKRFVNGRIDLLMETEERTVIVDYKYTDIFDTGKYAAQIQTYCEAVEKISGKKPVERYIFFLPSGRMESV